MDTRTLAIIGAITGIISTLFSAVTLLLKKRRLSIFPVNAYNFEDNSWLGCDLIIMNKSSLPISIAKVSVYSYNTPEIESFYTEKKLDMRSEVSDMLFSTAPPITISPFTSERVFLVFRYNAHDDLPKCSDDKNNPRKKWFFKFTTSRGQEIRKVKAPKTKSIHKM